MQAQLSTPILACALCQHLTSGKLFARSSIDRFAAASQHLEPQSKLFSKACVDTAFILECHNDHDCHDHSGKAVNRGHGLGSPGDNRALGHDARERRVQLLLQT